MEKCSCPCKGCEKRTGTCHDTCTDYKWWKDDLVINKKIDFIEKYQDEETNRRIRQHIAAAKKRRRNI